MTVQEFQIGKRANAGHDRGTIRQERRDHNTIAKGHIILDGRPTDSARWRDHQDHFGLGIIPGGAREHLHVFPRAHGRHRLGVDQDLPLRPDAHSSQ